MRICVLLRGRRGGNCLSDIGWTSHVRSCVFLWVCLRVCKCVGVHVYICMVECEGWRAQCQGIASHARGWYKLSFGYIHWYNSHIGERIFWDSFKNSGTGFMLDAFPAQVITSAHGHGPCIFDEVDVKIFVIVSKLVTLWQFNVQILAAPPETPLSALLGAVGVWASDYHHLLTPDDHVGQILGSGTVLHHQCGENVGGLKV